MNYNPYDLVELTITGKKSTFNTYGRPVEFDSIIADYTKMTNNFGQLVKPTKVTTTCEDCGQGYTVDIVMPAAVGQKIVLNCQICNPKQTLVDLEPFINPVESNQIRESELDPSLLDLSEKPQVNDLVELAEQLPVELTPAVTSPAESSIVESEQVRNVGSIDDKLVSDTGKASELTDLPQEEVDALIDEAKKKSPKKATKRKPTKAEMEAARAENGFVDYGNKDLVQPADGITPEVDINDL